MKRVIKTEMSKNCACGNCGGFEIPEQLLNQINECSEGGFVLFTFDDNEEPQIYATFDNKKSELALRKHIKDWADTLDTAAKKSVVKQIISELESED